MPTNPNPLDLPDTSARREAFTPEMQEVYVDILERLMDLDWSQAIEVLAVAGQDFFKWSTSDHDEVKH